MLNEKQSINIPYAKKTILTLGLFLFLNLLFQAISLHFGYKRNLLNAEMLFAFFLISLNLQIAGIVVFLISIGLEILLGIASVFYLFNAAQVWDMTEFIFEARHTYLFAMIITLVTMLAVGIFIARIQKKRSWRQALFILFFGVILIQSQWLLSSGNDTFFTPTLAERKHLLFGSTEHFVEETLATNGWQVMGGAPDEKTEYVPIRHPSAVQTLWGNNAIPARMLLIVDEAWGMPHDARVLEKQIEALRTHKNIKNLVLTSVYAKGATAAGELRELCSVIPTRLNFRKLTASTVGDCLPAKFNNMGYTTSAIHGAHGKMYNRAVWWPALGFDKVFLRETMPLKEVTCHSFPGYCDRTLLPLVEQRLQKDKVFVYWMTLNTHMPYDSRDVISYRKDLCSPMNDTESSTILCNYQNLHTQFFEGLASLANIEEMKGVDVLIVGDHPPIFDDQVLRDQFVDNQVPALSFQIR